MPQPPNYLVQRLRSYDRRLRARWSNFRKCWSIEWKALRHEDLEEPIMDGPVEERTTDPDVFIRFKDGYIPVLYAVGTNPYRIMDALILADMTTAWNGQKLGARKASEIIHLRENAEKEAAEKKSDFMATQYGKTCADLMAHYLGRTVSYRNGRGEIVTAKIVDPLETVSGRRPAGQQFHARAGS